MISVQIFKTKMNSVYIARPYLVLMKDCHIVDFNSSLDFQLSIGQLNEIVVIKCKIQMDQLGQQTAWSFHSLMCTWEMNIYITHIYTSLSVSSNSIR